MDDQNSSQGHQVDDNLTPFGQQVNNDNGALGVGHDQTANPPPNTQQNQPSPAPVQGPAKGFFDDDEDDDLLTIKKEALQQLNPLVEHLDQTPEEKFRTTMMLIQASDDQALVRSAYEAAQQIPDEKERARALLDVINEINYFTQRKK